MANKVIIKTKDNTEYTLEYTRESAGLLADTGFKLEDVKDNPLRGVPALFKGAFVANHRRIKDEVADEIYKGIKHKDEFIIELAKMYQETIDALLEEPEEDEGNSSWEVVK